MEVGNHRVMIVYSEQGRVKYYKASEDFEFRLQNLTRLPVPKLSVANEYFAGSARYSLQERKQEVWKATWFLLDDGEADSLLYEFCIPNGWNNSVVSVIWED